MTVKQLKEMLEDHHDGLEVFIKQNNTEFELSLLANAKEVRAKFSDGSLKAYETVLILEDI